LIYRWYLGIKENTFHWEDCKIFCHVFDHGTNWCVLHLWIFDGSDVNEVGDLCSVCFYVVCSEATQWMSFVYMVEVVYIQQEDCYKFIQFIRSFFFGLKKIFMNEFCIYGWSCIYPRGRLLQIYSVHTILFFWVKEDLFLKICFLNNESKKI
jgi:hypothetical protein